MMTREYRYVELVNERGAKRVLTLEPGRDTGVWCLAGDGTLRPAGPEGHGAKVFLRYDGARLFVGTQWEELEAPASTTTGGLRIAPVHRVQQLRNFAHLFTLAGTTFETWLIYGESKNPPCRTSMRS